MSMKCDWIALGDIIMVFFDKSIFHTNITAGPLTVRYTLPSVSHQAHPFDLHFFLSLVLTPIILTPIFLLRLFFSPFH